MNQARKPANELRFVYRMVASSPEIEAWWTTVFHNPLIRNHMAKSFVTKWGMQAVTSFQNSLRLDPSQDTYYNIGEIYAALGRKEEALDCLNKAQEGDDREVSVEAAKAIGRMNEKKGFCFVATACYGSYDHPDVIIFRRWRDRSLLSSFAGRLFVSFYYSVSPPLAKLIARVPRLACAVRKFVLEPLAHRLK